MSDEIHEDIRAAMEEAAATAPEEERHDEPGVADDGGDAPDAEPVEAEKEPVAEADAEPAPAEEGVKLDKERPPTSWNAKVREKWKELPDDVRSEVIRREEAHVNGIRKLQDEFTPVKQFTESLGGVIQEAASLGVAPAQYIHNLAAAERGLRTGAPEQKFETLLNLADQYGIPLRQAINGAAGKELLQQTPRPHQLPPEVLRELEEARNFRQTYQTDTLQQQVSAFSQGKEFFEDVREDMANLLDAGQASNLDEAYEKAIWLNSDTRAVLLEREKVGGKQSNLRARQAAASGASVRAGGAADVTVDTDDDDSIEALIRKSISTSSGRI